MLASRYLFYNTKRTLIMIISVTLASILLFIVGLLFSSVHSYMVNISLKENPYHVSFKSDNFKKPNFVLKMNYDEGTSFIKYKKISDTYKNTNLICKKVKCMDIKYNDRLLSLYGISKNENLMSSFKYILITVLVILGFGSMILISNAFRITLIERKKQIAILKSIGMTKNQIILMILEESLFILIISLAFSIVISLWFTEILVVGINYLLSLIFDIRFVLSIYPLFMILSLIFIVFTIFISSIIPAISISKTNIIDTIGGNNDYKVKLPRYAYRFKIINRLVYSNYYRLKKKYRAIKLCIFINVILYVSFSLYLSYGLSSINKYVNIPDYDFEIIGNDYKALDNLGKKYKKHKTYKVCFIKGEISKESYLDKNDYQKERDIVVTESNKEGIINKIKKEKDINKYLKYNARINGNNVHTFENVSFGLDGFIDKTIFLTDNFSNYCSSYEVMTFIKGDSKKILNDLKKLEIDTTYVDVGKAQKITNNFVLVIKICLYSVLILVVLIGISSVSNTFSVMLNLRMREMGILKGFGLTDRGLKKIIFRECLIVLFKIFIWVIPLSLFISYILYQSINGVVSMDMIYPFRELLIGFISSLFVLYSTLSINYRKIKRQSIIKMIACDNV